MKKLIINILKAIWVFIGFIVLYLLCGYLIPFIEVPAKKVSETKNVEIFILTNGVHTDLVVPIKSAEYDWSKEIRFENTLSKREDFKYLAIGWGDKGFYLETPTWAELKPSVAVKAAFWLSESAMHCTFYDQMQVGKDCKSIQLTSQQYQDLIKFINDKFDRDANGNPILIKTDAVYGKNDAFYDAKGSYSFLQTCNTWSNNGLKAAGQKAALWTPSDFGIFQHYE
ncbi:TIGR02117 family protein [Chryseobacterium suipulveris]|uniref:TIGR02117 family protein n=1 Tax=Chryseobacterium suipulveris TaxID=2929800 RepID=A0ABY4BSU6_9FLAO|nr:TIGR02117 family protein [Chryseobacterium suipulveris]UOE42259.1 TIGR02117 family protein [Chryseobacterium suipulveris]